MPDDREFYEWIKVKVFPDELRIQYLIQGRTTAGEDGFSEDLVGGYVDSEIESIVRAVLCVEDDDPVKIQLFRK